MKVYFLLSVLIASAHYSYAQDDDPDNNSIKNLIIREIMRKISNISLSSLSTASNEKRQLFLGKIKAKLKKTASGLPDGSKYINMIMKEIENKALNNGADEVENPEKQDSEVENKETQVKEPNPMDWEDNSKKKYLAATDKGSLKRKLFDNKSKQQIITDIANKINAMAKSHVNNAHTLDQKKNILRKIEGRILESSKRKHMQIHSQHTNLIAYASLIRQGLELSMKKLIESKSRRSGDPIPIEDFIPHNNDTNTINTKNIDAYKKLFSEIYNESSVDPHCNDIIEDICNRVEVLLKLPCGDGKSVVLDQLCDGVYDCWNEADEINCVNKAIGKVDRATALMADIDDSITNKCLQPLVDSAIITQHHETLLTMLQSQSQTLKNYKTFIGDEKSSDLNKDEDSFAKNISSDASKSVSSLLEALEVNLCSSHDIVDKSKISARKSWTSNAADTVIIIESAIKLNPKTCLCDGELCNGCAVHCVHICKQKYMLNRWKCRAVIGGTSISLNFICDGKSDCFDESDEEKCSTDSSISKYEANKIFLELLDVLSLKSLSEEYDQSRNKIRELISIVRQIQILSTRSNVDIHTVRVHRDKYFAKILDVYEDAQPSNLEQLNHIYDFLKVLKEKIVDAMKRTHMGNDFMMPSAGCYCRNGTCAVIRCPKKCIATCKIEPLLTKFSCQFKNVTVDAKAICNGKSECPNGEDEKNCKSDICRAHHLSVLRLNLQNVGESLKGTSLGEVLNVWKTKAISSLKVVESRGRPSKKVIKENVFLILQSLVSAYATMEDNTRKTNTGTTLKEFTKWANIVKDTLKSCTQ